MEKDDTEKGEAITNAVCMGGIISLGSKNEGQRKSLTVRNEVSLQ